VAVNGKYIGRRVVDGDGPFAILSPAFIISVSDGDRRFSVGHTATVPLLSNTAVGRTSWLVKYSTLSVFLRPSRSRFFFISNHLRRQRPGGRYSKKPTRTFSVDLLPSWLPSPIATAPMTNTFSFFKAATRWSKNHKFVSNFCLSAPIFVYHPTTNAERRPLLVVD